MHQYKANKNFQVLRLMSECVLADGLLSHSSEFHANRPATEKACRTKLYQNSLDFIEDMTTTFGLLFF